MLGHSTFSVIFNWLEIVHFRHYTIIPYPTARRQYRNLWTMAKEVCDKRTAILNSVNIRRAF